MKSRLLAHRKFKFVKSKKSLKYLSCLTYFLKQYYYQQCCKKWITVTFIKNKRLKAHALHLHDFVV